MGYPCKTSLVSNMSPLLGQLQFPLPSRHKGNSGTSPVLVSSGIPTILTSSAFFKERPITFHLRCNAHGPQRLPPSSDVRSKFKTWRYPHLMANRTRSPILHKGDSPQLPPPYQQTDPFLGSSHRVPFTSPHIHSENEPLLGRYRITYHSSHPVQESPAKNHRSSKFFRFIVIFLIGASIGYAFDRSYNYDLYERLWRHWAQEEEHRASIRAEWVEEVERHELHRIRMEGELTRWKEEKAAMDAERRKWEEEQERQRANLIWDEPQPGRCLRYATREYRATLSNIGIGMDGLGECAHKTLSFHGRDILPSFCNLEGPCGRVTGHWAIDFDEVGCSPWWDTLTDKGCDKGMHKHRYEAHLMNLQNKADWEILCKTTPTTINGIPYDGAMSCLYSFWGAFGIWFVEDTNCS